MLIHKHNSAKKTWSLLNPKADSHQDSRYYEKILPACSRYDDSDNTRNALKDKKKEVTTKEKRGKVAAILKGKMDRVNALYGLNAIQKESIAGCKKARIESAKVLKKLYDCNISNNNKIIFGGCETDSCCLEKINKPNKHRENELGDYIRMLHAKLMHITALSLGLPFKVKAKTFFGEKIELIFPDIVSDYIFQDGFFEKELTTILLKYLKPGMVFFDIGAHFGYFSLLASNLVGSRGCVCSFEPTKSTFEVLKQNVKDKTNVYLENLAVFSENMTIDFNDYGVGFSAFNSLYEPRLDTALKKKIRPRSYQVNSISIDEYIKKTGMCPNFIKIDAESAEYPIILGMKRTMVKFRPIITTEVGDKDIDGVISSKELIGHIIENGYTPYEFQDGNVVKHKIRERYWYDNILFLPDR